MSCRCYQRNPNKCAISRNRACQCKDCKQEVKVLKKGRLNRIDQSPIYKLGESDMVYKLFPTLVLFERGVSVDNLDEINDSLEKTIINFNKDFENVIIDNLSNCLYFLDKLKNDIINLSNEKNHRIIHSIKLITIISKMMTHQRCCLCNVKVATTTEHSFKASILNTYHPIEVGEKTHYKNEVEHQFTKAKGLITGQKKDLCADCNNVQSKMADYNFDIMFNNYYKFIMEKHRLNKNYSETNGLLSELINNSKINTFSNAIYSFSPRDLIILPKEHSNFDEIEVKRYFAKIIATQVGFDKVPCEIRNIFFDKENLDLINYKVFNVGYDFKEKGLDTMLNKSVVLGQTERTPKNLCELAIFQMEGYQKVILEIAMGAMVIQIDYGGFNLDNIDLYKIYDHDKLFVEKYEELLSKIKK